MSLTALGHQTKRESPEYIRTSTAAAITMGKLPGRFLRQARLYCINLLLTYDEGCAANCAYCGLSDNREAEESCSEQSFIRVEWPTLPLNEVISSIPRKNCSHVERVCISMITNGRSLKDTINTTESLKKVTDNISVLITPTIVNKEWLSDLKKAGADMIGARAENQYPSLYSK
jgi:biotin synthase